MREIFFRGKRVDNKKWVYGYLSFIYWDVPEKARIYSPDEARSFDVITETIGQFTGLCDKNGTRIFEWDIVGAKHPDQKKAVPCLVKYGEYEDEDGRVDCRYLGFCLEVFDKCCSILTPLSDGIEYEVIGNIFDNKELLEVTP